MITEIKILLQMKQFFTVLQLKNESVKFMMKKPSLLLLKNIQANWLKYNHAKSKKHFMPVYLNESTLKLNEIPSVYGTINQSLQEYDEQSTIELKFSNCCPMKKSVLQFNIIVPQQNAMQYFIQWQRYRKYWWSSISTTPSLFAVNEFKHKSNTTYVEIVAQLHSGPQPVESVSLQSNENELSSRLTCSLCLEDALFILLIDGLPCDMDEYLRLHREIAPFKISFALDAKEETVYKDILCRLATLLHHKLESKKISTWLPDCYLPLESQITEYMRMGVPYTAILDNETLQYGIFRLMNSSTKLMEHLHLADFEKHAERIFESKS